MGVTLNYKQAIKQVLHDSYSKAERWLNQVHPSVDGKASVKEAVQPLSV